MGVFLLSDQSFLSKALPLLHSSQRYCLSLQEISPSADALLTKYHVKTIDVPVWSDLHRDKFMRDFITLMGQINFDHHSRMWWANDFSSKNRFQCRLPELLEKFMSIIRVVVEDKDADFVVVGAPWELRKSLKLVFPCRDYAPWGEGFRIRLRAKLRRIASAIYHLGRAFYRMAKCHQICANLEKRIDQNKQYYVIKSFVYDSSFKADGKYQDAYFGSLPYFLQENGEQLLFVVDILGDLKGCLHKIKSCPNALIIPLDMLSSVSSMIVEHWRAAWCNPQVAQKYYFQNYDVSGIVNRELFVHSGRVQPYQLMQYSQIKALLSTVMANTFLTPCENNPWEKMCIMAFRKFSPRTKVLAYQHNVTPEASTNMFNAKEDEEVAPYAEKLFTVGEIAKTTIEKYSTATIPSIQVGAALRLEYLFKLQPLIRPGSGTILLGLEGILEVYKLVNYVLSQVNKNENRKIIIRTHPVLPVSKFAHRLIAPLSEYPFIEVSQGKTVAQDIGRSDMMIYWGSTIALEALWMGRPVIHYDMNSVLNYDPVVGDCPLRWKVKRGDSLFEQVAKIEAMTPEVFSKAQHRTKQYLEQYFQKPTPTNMSLFLPQRVRNV